jgi:NMD protein affecting ribosome stability and mRNA decay
MSKQIAKTAMPGVQPVYQSKPLQEHVDDSYKSRGKLPEPAICSQCGAVYQEGRWRWLPKPDQAHEVVCPACHRIRDAIAAGHVRLEGEFLAQHREEILNLVRHVEQHEKAGHPLQRIMAISDEDGAVLVTTTDVHLARGIGEAVRHAYQGNLELKYGHDENLVHVHWKR